MSSIESLRPILDAVNQSHVLQFWNELGPEQQTSLAAQIESIDFDLLATQISGKDDAEDWADLASRAESPPSIRLSGEGNPFPTEEAHAMGEKAYRDGKVAIVIVAGGQGSRLGFPHPKGMYPLGPVSGRTLYQIHADRVIAASTKYGKALPVYVMTSPATHEETKGYFEENANCGLDDLSIFCQGTMPAVDAETGKLILEEKDRLFMSPDGHGGTLAALDRSGSLADMKQRGIEWLFYFQIDNPMVAIDDPEFVGYHILSRSEMTSQVVAKVDPLEKVGNVVSVDGVLRVIEYSDLPDEQAARRNDDGSLAIWAGSIAVHVFDVAFLDRAKSSVEALPFHRAHKKVPFVNGEGRATIPDAPNAIKFERFIFDLLPSAKNTLVVEVDEAEAFAPLKNAAGAPKDTEATCKAAMSSQHAKWLRQAGATVADEATVEINPRFAANAAEVAAKVDAGTTVEKDHYFRADA
jgi:UDP-N-acetylglucosamine/UDP-N-acetylgalactosamine diphosphorylase